MNRSAKFEQFFKENYTLFYLYVYRIIEDADVSRDIVNDVFEYAWANYDNEVKNWKTYSYSYLKSKAIDYIRHQNVEKKYIEFYLSEINELYIDYNNDQQETIENVQKIIKTLPLQTQKVLELCYFQNKKYKEAAVELNISTNTIKKHIVRALRIIRVKVRGE